MTSRFRWTRATRIALAAPLLWAATAMAQERDREDVKARERYMRLQRAYPDTDVAPALARETIRWRTMPRVAASRAAISPQLLPASATWTPLGPFGLLAVDGYFNSLPQQDAGRVTGVAFDPNDPNTFYIASASGGVWKSTTGGASWTTTSDGQCSLDLGAMAVDPKNSSIVYAGTGELNAFSFGCGVLRSTDGGATWRVLGESTFLPDGVAYSPIGSIVVDPTTAGSATSTTVLVGSSWGVFRSQDAGASWSRVMPGSVYSIAMNPQDPRILFAGNVDFWSPASRGTMRSADGGTTWTTLSLPTGVVVDDLRRMELATSSADPGKVWVAIAKPNGTLAGFWLYDDATGQWTKLAASGLSAGERGNLGGQLWYDLLLVVDPTDANRIYLGGERLYRSLDGGATFSQIGGNVHVDWHTMRIDPRDHLRLLAGNDGGVFLSQDGGDTWLSRNAGLQITQYYPGLSVQPNSATIVAAGAQDNGTQWSNGMPTWESFLDGDGGFTAINYVNPGIQWAEAEWFDGPAIVRYGNGVWRSVNAGINSGDRAAFLPPLVMSPITPTTLYFGTQRLYQTTDEQTWVPLSTSTDLSKGSGYITAIAPAKSDANTIYVGTSDGQVLASTDGGVTFGASGGGLPNRWVSDLAVDVADAKHAIVTFSGSGVQHVWQTTDGGTTWTSISGTGTAGAGALPDISTNAIVMVPSTKTLLVGTDAGVWQSGDGGTTWQPGPGGLPNVVVNDLVYNPTTQQLVAATYGRGVWTTSLAAIVPVLRGDVNHDAAVDAQDALLVQDALVGIALGTDAQGHALAALPSGDANCDALLDTGDVLAILRAAVGLAMPGSCAGTQRDRTP